MDVKETIQKLQVLLDEEQTNEILRDIISLKHDAKLNQKMIDKYFKQTP